MKNPKVKAEHDCGGKGAQIVQWIDGVWLLWMGLGDEYEAVILYCPFCGVRL